MLSAVVLYNIVILLLCAAAVSWVQGMTGMTEYRPEGSSTVLVQQQ